MDDMVSLSSFVEVFFLLNIELYSFCLIFFNKGKIDKIRFGLLVEFYEYKIEGEKWLKYIKFNVY